jgi:hypothetical protein
MTTYTWAVDALYTETIADQQDYVVIANYTLVGVDGEYEASISNTARFSTESVSEFIPYADLTERNRCRLDSRGTWALMALPILRLAYKVRLIQKSLPPVSPVNTPLPF